MEEMEEMEEEGEKAVGRDYYDVMGCFTDKVRRKVDVGLSSGKDDRRK